MARFVIEVMETWQMVYEVEAPSEQEAIAFVQNGMSDDDHPTCEMTETVEFHCTDRVIDFVEQRKD